VGLVGAGPWAEMVHAPVLAAGPETRLAGVWARRPEAAEALASRHDSKAFERLEELFDSCDAVAFAVPPAVQAELAVLAAERGKALLLEKPIADDLAGAERLADAVGSAGVASMVVLSWRYGADVRAFLDQAAELHPVAGRGAFVSGALLGGPFATPWRLERGPLLDLGPHVIDLLDAALGRVTGVRAHAAPHGWVGILLEHQNDGVSEASLCASVPLQPHRAAIEVYGAGGLLELDLVTAVGPGAFKTLREEFAQTVVAGGGHPLDVQRGLHLQRVLAAAEADIKKGSAGQYRAI